MRRFYIFRLLGAFAVMMFIAGCVAIGPVDSQDFPQMVKSAVSGADGEIHLYGPGNWHPGERGFKKMDWLDFTSQPPEPYPGVLVVTNKSVLFLEWNEKTKMYSTAKRLPFAELASVSLDSSGLNRRIVLQKKDLSYDSFAFTKAKGIIIDTSKTEETAAFLHERIKPGNISPAPAVAKPIQTISETKIVDKLAQHKESVVQAKTETPIITANYTVPHFDTASLVTKPNHAGWVHYIGFSWKGSLVNNQPHGRGLCAKLFKGQLVGEMECIFSHGVRMDEAYRLARISAIAAGIADQNAAARAEAEDQARYAEIRREEREQEAAAYARAMQTYSSTLNSEMQSFDAQQAETRERLERSVASGNAAYQRRQAEEDKIKAEILAQERRQPAPAVTVPEMDNNTQVSAPTVASNRDAAKPLRFVMYISLMPKQGDKHNPGCYSNMITRPGPPGWGTPGFLPTGSAEQARAEVYSLKDAFIARCRASGREITGEGNFDFQSNQDLHGEQDLPNVRPRFSEDVSVTL